MKNSKHSGIGGYNRKSSARDRSVEFRVRGEVGRDIGFRHTINWKTATTSLERHHYDYHNNLHRHDHHLCGDHGRDVLSRVHMRIVLTTIRRRPLALLGISFGKVEGTRRNLNEDFDGRRRKSR